MTILERLQLIRAGYTRREIDQMIEDDKKKPEDDGQDPEPEEQDPEPEEQDPEPEDESQDPGPDYKKLYEDSRKALEDLQAQNRRRDNSNKDKKSDADIVKDAIAGFF